MKKNGLDTSFHQRREKTAAKRKTAETLKTAKKSGKAAAKRKPVET